MFTAITLGIASCGSASHAIRRLVRPRPIKIGFRPPKIGSRILRHAIAVTTSGTIQGSSINPVSTFRNGTRLLSNNAIVMPTTSLLPTDAAVNWIVFATASRYEELVSNRS